MTLRQDHLKLNALCNFIAEKKSMAIAFSGGVDSTFLAYVAHEILGNQMLAITVNAPYVATWEIDEAVEWTTQLKVPHMFLEVGIDVSILNNPADRCYLCKKVIFSRIQNIALEHGFSVVADGSNADDVLDYRPGMKALSELKIESPLMACNITKDEIRQWSKALGLSTWDKPPYACLLTRLPYGTQIETSDLRQIEAAESFMFSKGFKAVRVRKHGDLARVEIAKSKLSEALDVALMREISMALKALGFQYVTLDLEGYETGSFNKAILKGGAHE